MKLVLLLWTAATLVAAFDAEAQASAPGRGSASALPERRLASPHSKTLNFEQALTRAYETRGLGHLPSDALHALENPETFEWPQVRAEGAWSDVRKIDIVHDSLLVMVDYPILDGGMRELRRRASQRMAASFRERERVIADRVFDETVNAFARLYVAQERHRILERAMPNPRRVNEMLAAHEISNLTAAQWQDEAIAAEAQLVDLEIERVDAEAKLKQLIGSSESLEVLLDFNATAPRPPRSLAGARDDLGVEIARAARKPQLMLSAFGGVASLPGEDRSSLFGLRATLTLSTFDTALRRREAEARLEAATRAVEKEPQPVSRDLDLVDRRIELLERAVEVAKQRGESLSRLANAGLRSQASLAAATIDVARRESELLAARVERWRLRQLAR